MNNLPQKESHFQAVLFVLLLVASVLYFTYSAFTPGHFLSPYGVRDQDITGILFLFWTGLMISKMLWMLEINIFSRAFRAQCKSDDNLPQRLLNDLSYRHMVQNAARSWKSLNILSITWLALGGLFILWGALVVYTPLSHDGLTHVKMDIMSFLKDLALEHSAIQIHNLSFLFSQMIKICLIGIVFWLGQTLSYGYKNTSTILWVCLVLFALSLLSYITGDVAFASIFQDLKIYSDNFWHGYGWMNVPIMSMMEIIPTADLSPFQSRVLSTGIPSVAIVYSMSLLAFIVMMQGLFLMSDNKKHALIGCGILLLMGFCDIFLVQKSGIYGVWISGWACVAILWVKSGSRARKHYRMFMK